MLVITQVREDVCITEGSHQLERVNEAFVRRIRESLHSLLVLKNVHLTELCVGLCSRKPCQCG